MSERPPLASSSPATPAIQAAALAYLLKCAPSCLSWRFRPSSCRWRSARWRWTG